MTNLRVVQLVDADRRLGASLVEPCAEAGFVLAGTHSSVEALIATAAQPDIVVLDSAAAAGSPAAGVRTLLQRWPGVCVVVTGGTAPMISHAVAAGARGFLLKPYAPADLVAVLRESFESTKLLTGGARTRGHLVAVYSPKGGTGCSTIAIALAVLSAARPNTSVALVDLDLQFGDVAVMLDLKAASSIADLLDHEQIDTALVNDTFIRHSSGVRVLAAPSDLATVSSIDPAKVDRTLASLRDHFDLVICDLWPSLDDLTSRVLRAADITVLVTKPELPALKSMGRLLSARALNLDLENTAIIVANRLPARGGLTGAEIERSLSRAIGVAIPSDGAAIVDAINRGIPVVDARVRSRAQHAYRELNDAMWSALEAARSAESERPLVA